MSKTICGLDCSKCSMKNDCKGCNETAGKPFGGSCVIALCCEKDGCENCGHAFETACELKTQLIKEFNELGINDMPEITELYALVGGFVNLEYELPGGQKIKFWDDRRVYLGNQVEKKDSERCYGLTADENYLLVCEYGCNGADPEIIVYKRREKKSKVDSRCGLHCTTCDYKEPCNCGGCIETNGHPFHGECPVAICCQDRGYVHCGECHDIPCELLTQYSCDPEHGDAPHGARIEQCKRWKKESEEMRCG